MQESEYFTQELSLDINYSSRFVQYPHYPIACCLPHLSMVAHNCHGKSINLTAKRKRLAAKFLRYHFSCREVMVILLAARLFFLPWGFSCCSEVNSFAVTVVGHRTFEILFPKILDFSTCGYSWELAWTLLIWLAFKPLNLWTGPFRKRWTFLYIRQLKQSFHIL